MRRAALFAATIVFLLVLVVAGVIWLISTLFSEGWIAAVWAVAVVLVAAIVVRRVIRGVRVAAAPMGELIEASARVEGGEFGAQVRERGPGEVRALARAFNAMSARLAETDQQRRRLLADVSHELRTPLTVIQGNVEGMLDGLYPADRAHLERILAETHHLARLIEDLRTMSLAEAGTLALNREPTDLGSLASDVVAGLEPQAAAAGVVLTATASDDLPEIEVDPPRIRQVIANLVSNALRHTPRGGRVTVSAAHDDAQVTLAVTDTGSGMDADTAKRAFDRFWRTPDSPGAGLGLAIVQDLVAAHGGDVELRTALGEGTSIVCRFPIGSGVTD